jgi:hypothetical protein
MLLYLRQRYANVRDRSSSCATIVTQLVTQQESAREPLVVRDQDRCSGQGIGLAGSGRVAGDEVGEVFA